MVYIGKSTSLDNRIGSHNVILNHFTEDDYFMDDGELCKNPLIYITSVENEYWLSIYEITLISKYKPKYNNSDKYETDTFVELPQFEWIPYMTKDDALHKYIMVTGKLIDEELFNNPIDRYKLLKKLIGGE